MELLVPKKKLLLFLSFHFWTQMTQCLQVQWSWSRIFPEQSLCPGHLPRMRRGTTDCITQFFSETPQSALGGKLRTTSLTISTQSSTFCQGESIASEFLPRTTWVSHLHLNPRCLRLKRRKVGSF